MSKQKKFKPDCELIGADSNIFNLMGIATRTLRANGMAKEAAEMSSRIMTSCSSYEDAISVLGEYVNVISVDKDQGMGGMGGM